MMSVRHANQPRADRIFLLGVAVLIIFGLVVLISASNPVGFARFHDPFFYIKRQLLFGLLPGLVLFVLLAKIDYHVWQKYSWAAYLISLVLLAGTLVPGIGLVINGSRSWIQLAGFSFQPAELAKLIVVIMAARLLTQKKHDWDDWQASVFPILTVLGIPIALVLIQPDIGTVSILVVIVFAMLYLAKVPFRYLLILSLVGVICFFGMVMARSYRTERLTAFLHPELDPKGVGYQINQAFLALGSGGLWGLGYGNSRQKFQYLPEVHADSIYAIIGEELGFFVAAGLVIILLLLAFRGFTIAKHAPDEFGSLLVAGVMVWLLWQSFLNMGAMVGAFPLTGVPLPFISHGGSALITMFAAMGIVVNVSKYSKLETRD